MVHSLRERWKEVSKMQHHYGRFLIMIVLHFIAMYIFMYAMVNVFDNVFNSLNQVYMAALMTASMVLIELPLMSSMYQSKKLNMIILAAVAIMLIGAWFGIRQQAAIGDRQFLRSMIPHHAGAILMCQQASIQDQEIRTLCNNIISGQRAEIDQMKTILSRLDK
jgi:cation transport ATPase